MEIISLPFLLSIIIFLGIYQVLPNKVLSFWLLIGSLFFYGSISPVLCGVLIVSIGINFLLSKSNFKYKNAIAVCFNIGLMTTFKLQPNNILVPIGISFFSLQALSFIFDNKKGVSLINFANYLSFFPQLIAGPIESFDHLGPQIISPQKIKFENFISGAAILTKGLVFKLVFADRCGVIVDRFYENPIEFDAWFLVISNLLFTFQILLDFSGYCLMAIGLAKILGIELTNNFNKPYLATSISDFWRRWHITLHIWFKKYVYKNLNKGWILGSLVVFILSGLWHGINTIFLIWGLVCFLIFWLDRILFQKIQIKFINWLLTFLLISFSWIFFRVESFEILGTVTQLSFESTPIKLFIADIFYSLSHLNFIGYLEYNSVELGLTFSDWFILLFGLPILGFSTYKTMKTKVIHIFVWFLVLCFFGYNDSTPFIYLQF